MGGRGNEPTIILQTLHLYVKHSVIMARTQIGKKKF